MAPNLLPLAAFCFQLNPKHVQQFHIYVSGNQFFTIVCDDFFSMMIGVAHLRNYGSMDYTLSYYVLILKDIVWFGYTEDIATLVYCN